MAPRKYSLGARAASVEETRRRIVEATFALHGERGVVATSMADIARRADVSVGTVYRHFPTLAELVRACGEVVAAVADPPKPDLFSGVESLSQRVRLLVRKLFGVYDRIGERLAMTRCEADQVPELAAWLEQWQKELAALVREALGPATRDDRALYVTMAFTDLTVWESLLSQGMNSESAADLVSEVLLAWLGSPLSRKGVKFTTGKLVVGGLARDR